MLFPISPRCSMSLVQEICSQIPSDRTFASHAVFMALIPEESIEGLLGEIPMQTLPAGGRYTKEDLVQQCLLDPERAERLLEELDHMDGNVGAVSQAVVEVIDISVLLVCRLRCHRLFGSIANQKRRCL